MTVYAVQQQMKFDESAKEIVPRFPLIRKAERFGRIEYILSPTAHAFHPPSIVPMIHESLQNFCNNDHLLLIGNPGLIGMCFSIAARNNDGKVKFLQWSGRHRDYIEISSEIF
jgi:hypothetical protein